MSDTPTFCCGNDPRCHQGCECQCHKLERELAAVTAERDEAAAQVREMRSSLEALLEVAEQSVDTRRCSTGILRAMNDARRLLATAPKSERR